MTTTQPGLVEWATPAEREEAARDLYRRTLAAGERLTGAGLGALFGRSARWGRYRIAEARQHDISNDQAAQDAADTSGSASPDSGRRNGSPTTSGNGHPLTGPEADAATRAAARKLSARDLSGDAATGGVSRRDG